MHHVEAVGENLIHDVEHVPGLFLGDVAELAPGVDLLFLRDRVSLRRVGRRERFESNVTESPRRQRHLQIAFTVPWTRTIRSTVASFRSAIACTVLQPRFIRSLIVFIRESGSSKLPDRFGFFDYSQRQLAGCVQNLDPD